MVSAAQRAKKVVDLKGVVDNVLDIEFFDVLLAYIHITEIGYVMLATRSNLDKASRFYTTAGDPDISIADHDVTMIPFETCNPVAFVALTKTSITFCE